MAFTDHSRPTGKYLSLSKLKEVGDSYTITITGDYTERPFVPFGKTEPATTKAGKVVTEYLIPGMNHDAESEDEAQSLLVIDKYAAKRAIGKACEAVSVSDIASGGTLTISFSGYGLKKGEGYPPKEFEATYFPPEAQGGAWGAGDDEDE